MTIKAMISLTTLVVCVTMAMTSASQCRFEVSAGHHTARCTYLSTQTYTGPGYGLTFEWSRPTWLEGSLTQSAHADVQYGYLLSKSKNSRMYDLSICLEWGVEKTWTPAAGWKISAGGASGIDGGVMYLPRNGNNPAQAQMWAGVSLSAHAGYENLHLLGRRITLSGTLEIPTVGCFFSPAYGETYYEIYLGNHNGLAHFGWWGNRPQIKSRLRADWLLGRHALTLGVDYRYQGLECNHLTTRRADISAVVGLKF